MTTLPTPADAQTADAPALHQWLDRHRASILDDVVDLVARETPSDRPDLLDKGLAHLQDLVDARLGPPQRRSLHEGGEFGSALVLDYPGTGGQQVVALAHYDTVFDAGTLAEWPVTVEGDRVSGPGVFDMKAGLVQMVWALRALGELGVPRPPVRLVLNGDEEIGSPFSRGLIEDVVRDAAAALVFEASAPGGAVKTARKGVGLFDVVATGVESHAGLDPLAGASAVREIAAVVTALHQAADLPAGTSINVGVLRGGRRRNVVAGSATAGVDVRVATVEEQQRVDRLLASLHAEHPHARLEVRGEWNRPVMTRTPQVERLYRLAGAVAQQLGFELPEATVGGASDGNFVAALGVPVLDGLGAVGDGAHARHEHASVDGMVQRAALAAGVLAPFASTR